MQNELYERLNSINIEFSLYANEVLSFVEDGDIVAASKVIEDNTGETRIIFTETLAEIINTYDENLKSSTSVTIADFEKGTIFSLIIFALGIIFIILTLGSTIISAIKRLDTISNLMTKIANGEEELSTQVPVIKQDEIDSVASSFNKLTSNLVEQNTKEQELLWTKSNIAEITTSMSGAVELESLGSTLLSKVVPLVDSSHAVFYVRDISNNEPAFKLVSTYAHKERKHILPKVKPGEGLIGQAIYEKTSIILTDVPNDYIKISSGLGEAVPANVYVLPIIFENEVKAVLEFATLKPFTEAQKNFLEELIQNIGIVIESVMSRIQLAHLLEESQTLMEEIQAQSEELQNQQEELKATNEELEAQTFNLRQSEEKLQRQQEELEETNTELEEKARRLEEQNIKFEETNRLVEKARAELEIKAEQLALSSKYKSEFLANMSHELRTPLNSLIILSKLLADNPDENLTNKQIEFAKTIYSSGNDLLKLINNILDLAKIESGKTEILPNEIKIPSIVELVETNFKSFAESKNLSFSVEVKEGTPTTLYSDIDRIQQILNNLLSNAFKFTKIGGVKLEISFEYRQNKPRFAFSVIDTGIGISKDKQLLIFEAFQQADGTTSRKFGGTGLGLSISKELATLLGGEITVESEDGKGSRFTFYVSDYQNGQQAIKGLNEVAALVDHPITTSKNAVELSVAKNIENKKVTFKDQIKKLLIIDDDLNQRNSLMELIGDMDFVIKAVPTGHQALELLKVNHFDCVILDLGLGDTSGFEVLDRIKTIDHQNKIKVIIYTGRELTNKEELYLSKFAHTIIIKNEYSPDRLKNELELFLHEDLMESSSNAQIDLPANVAMDLTGKRILLVDDDVRNVFSLTSVLEFAGCEVLFAENGLESLKMLDENNEIDLVLMDIMMPEMDGYEAIQQIRSKSQFKELPIIALTAKAMKEDREKCLMIGASDYIAKPVEPDQLISLIKVWVY
ncbi:histidine kinase OS=Ureibacillus acetophenoni OX=614649 GN=SAMN05877842_103152 PE=4 SV=1 [Ureibacillus acetophenoni]